VTGQPVGEPAKARKTAAATVLDGRVPSPEGITQLGADRLRECDLSRPKVGYLLDFAGRRASGALDIGNTASLDDEVITALTAVRGIGLWSAQTFLIR
jgi:3-methyladenine DNA glycosylase/8-oxoguanine DNA glycosylase